MRTKKAKRENPRHRKIRMALESLGHRNVKVWWEPLGPSFEMCGPSGGYFFKSEQAFEPLGWDFEMALKNSELYAPHDRHSPTAKRGSKP